MGRWWDDLLQNDQKLLLLSAAGNISLLGALLLAERIKSQRQRPSEIGSDKKSPGVGLKQPTGQEMKLKSLKSMDPMKIIKKSDPLENDGEKQGKETPANNDIYTIVLTGGPCAGKTTALAEITMHAKKFGAEVLCVPETATLTMMGGGNIVVRDFPPALAIRREVQIVEFIQTIENYFKELAEIKKHTHKGKILLLCDRGCMDARAYLPEELWQAILDQKNWNPITLSHKRYDMVLHLVTCADGAEEFYTTDNNQARYETVDEAVDIDKKLQFAYNGHPHHKIIKNVRLKDFKYKIGRVIEETMNCLELVEGNQGDVFELTTFRYLMKDTKFVYPQDVKVETVHVEEYVLEPQESGTNTTYRLLIKQTRASAIDYYLNSTTLNKETGVRRYVQMKKISVTKYMELLDQISQSYWACKITKQNFIHSKRTFSVETLTIGERVVHMLTAGRGKDDKYADVDLLPDFIQSKIQKVVTDDNDYDFTKLYIKQ